MPCRKKRSYVWHYFNLSGSTIKCRICRHELEFIPRHGTTLLIQHLERIHGLRERGVLVKDISSIPTISMWPKKLGKRMSRRVLESFEKDSGGSWQCKKCFYVCQIKKLRPMFYHLKTVHWKANGPASADDFVPVNHDGITGNGSGPPSSRNMRSCMRKRVFESFEETGPKSTWRCKNCTYTCQERKLLKMLHHLRTVHWKTNGPASADEFVPKNKDGLTGNFTGTLNAGKQKTENDARSRSLITNSNNVSNKIGEDEPRTFDDVHNESGASSNSSSAIVDEESTMIANGNGHYKIRINLPDGSEVEGFVVGGADDLNNDKEDNLDRDNIHGKSRIVSKKKELPSKLQTDVDEGMNQEFKDDDVSDLSMDPDADERMKSDHWYSKKFGRNLDETPLRRSKIPRSSMAVQNGRRMKSEKLCPPKLEIQVPLQNVQHLTTDIKFDGNEDRTSIKPYKYVKTEKTGKKQNVAVITLNRPRALNGFSKRLVNELNDAVIEFDNEDTIGAIIITGQQTVFAVDFTDTAINEMQNHMSAQKINKNATIKWNCISKTSKPVIAAVNGYALGGGCKLAMMCDIIYAGDKARFSQPEDVIGTISGTHNTQKLTRAIGKNKATEMVLTRNQISAVEAQELGLVSKIFPPDQLLDETIKLGERIFAHSQLIVSKTKKAVNSAYETMIKEGLIPFKKKLFCGTITTEAGVTCTFGIDKRSPELKAK